MDTPATPATTPIPVVTTKTTTPQSPVPTPQASKPAETSAPEMFEVKVNGEMKKFTLEELKKKASKAAWADAVASQGKEALSAMKKLQAERDEERALAKKDRAAFLKRFELDEETMAREVVERKLARHEMTPEQRESADLRDQLSERDKRLAELKEQEDSKASAAKQQRLQSQMENSLFAAAEAAGIQRDGDSFYAIYESVRDWAAAGLPWDAERIVEQAKERIDSVPKRIQEAVLKGAKGKALVDLLGPEVVAEVLRHKIEEHRGGGAQLAKTAVKAQGGAEETYVSTHEAEQRRLERMRKLSGLK